MKFSEIKNLSLEELNKRYSQMQEEQFELRMKHSLGQVGNPLQIRKIRKDIARVLTAKNLTSSEKTKLKSSEPTESKRMDKARTIHTSKSSEPKESKPTQKKSLSSNAPPESTKSDSPLTKSDSPLTKPMKKESEKNENKTENEKIKTQTKKQTIEKEKK